MRNTCRKPFLYICIVLFLILLLPLYPYKLPDIFDKTGDNNIRLEVRHHESKGSMEIIGGKDAAENYIKLNKDKHVSTDSVIVIGKTPYEELSCFYRGTSKYRDFIIYGQFARPDKCDELSFKVEEWYAMNADGSSKIVPLIDSKLWYNNRNLFKVILLIDLIILLTTLILFSATKGIKKQKQRIKLSLKDYDSPELEIVFGNSRRGYRKEQERKKQSQELSNRYR